MSAFHALYRILKHKICIPNVKENGKKLSRARVLFCNRFLRFLYEFPNIISHVPMFHAIAATAAAEKIKLNPDKLTTNDFSPLHHHLHHFAASSSIKLISINYSCRKSNFQLSCEIEMKLTSKNQENEHERSNCK